MCTPNSVGQAEVIKENSLFTLSVWFPSGRI